MRATLKNLNEFIKQECPDLDIEMVKGKGYFYFIGEDGYNCESIMVFALGHMPYEQWLSHIQNAIINRTIDEPCSWVPGQVIKL